jgi:cysteine desulfurase
MHYLDNAATTKVTESAANAVMNAMTRQFGNPSSVHSLGIEAEGIVDRARGEIARSFGCKPEEICFTSGGTEADNLALIKGAELLRRRGKHIITTAVEHSAVSNAAKYMEENGFEVTYLTPGKEGAISLDELEREIRPDTVLVSMMLVNNETGVLQPVTDAVKLFKSKNPDGLFHTDAVQAYMKRQFSVNSLGVDLLTVSSHKIHGPKGAGALYIRNGLKLKPIVHGGGQEFGLRSGTEAVPAIAGFGEAVREAYPVIAENIAHVDKLRQSLIDGLQSISGVSPIASGGAIVNIAVPKYPTEVIIRMLESRGIFVSGGSACSRGKKSRILEAMKVPQNLLKSSIRISLSWHNSEEDIDTLLSALNEIS